MSENNTNNPIDNLALDQEAYDSAASAFDVAQQPWTPELVQNLTIIVLIFCALGLVGASILLWKIKASAEDILKIYGIVIIVGLSTLLLIVGYGNEQLTPIIGLFGAIVGYLLGKEAKVDVKKEGK